MWLKGELKLAYKSYVDGNSYYCYYNYCFLYLMRAGNNEPFRVIPSTCVDNTDTTYMVDQDWQ